MEISFTSLKKTITNFFVRYHVVIFSVIVIGGLSVVVLILNSIITSASDTSNYVPAGSSATFDEATIKRVNELKARSETGGNLTFPEGRINPFVE